jgi:hypothetical protein
LTPSSGRRTAVSAYSTSPRWKSDYIIYYHIPLM